ncbi:MAG: helix-turn-helix transcriptional regulator, partial [Clostridia bacterium]|nr:helix-turn-helix transcriptional regulator [Clostridia bacterium]
FRRDFNKTVTEYIREKRISYADTLLKTTNLSVSEIAFGCGFQSIQTFNRLYKEYYNQTPSRNKKALP